MGERLNKQHHVTVLKPSAVASGDGDRLRNLLAVEPLTVHSPTSPWVTVDERIHTAASRWLYTRTQQAASTVEANARDIARYIDYLVNERHLWHADEGHSDAFVASYDDLLAFQRSFLGGSTSMRGAWNRINSSIKQFHEFCQIEYRLPLPWTPKKVMSSWTDRPVTSNTLSLRTKRGNAGLPLHPDFVDLLTQAALRLDAQFDDRGGLMARRDLSFISHGLGTGMRRNSLRLATVYEVPPASSARHGWNIVRVPDAITKGLAGSVAIGFEHRLAAVRDYIGGTRKMQVEASIIHHAPERPLRIVETDLQGWKAIDEATGELQSCSWADSDEAVRKRLMEPDGSSPVIHLGFDGRPMSADTASAIVRDARRFAQQHLDPTFPSVRLHDLRHTYAVHLAVCIFHDRVAKAIDGPASEAWRNRSVADAVAAVQASLGHASPQTTSTYITHTTEHILSGTAPERYLGA